MRRPDDLLAPDEPVVLRTGLHAAAFGGALGYTAFVLGTVALIVARNELEPRTVATLWGAGAVVVALGWVMPLLRWAHTAIVVTPRRLLAATGALRVRVLEVPEPDARVVAVEQTLVGRGLGYGTVQLAAPDGQVLVLHRVASAEALRAAAAGRAGRQNRARGR